MNEKFAALNASLTDNELYALIMAYTMEIQSRPTDETCRCDWAAPASPNTGMRRMRITEHEFCPVHTAPGRLFFFIRGLDYGNTPTVDITPE